MAEDGRDIKNGQDNLADTRICQDNFRAELSSRGSIGTGQIHAISISNDAWSTVEGQSDVDG